MMIHDLLPILEYPVIGILISVNKNPAYQDIHSIQTNTPVYETLRIITNERFTVLCFTLIFYLFFIVNCIHMYNLKTVCM